MIQHRFEMPPGSKSDTKAEQLQTLNYVRSYAAQAHERRFLSHRAITQQIEASLAAASASFRGTHHLSSNYNVGPTGFEDLNNDLTIDTLTEDDINTFSHKSTASTSNRQYNSTSHF